MTPAHLQIKFDNLLYEARWKFHAGDFVGAQEILAEAQVLAKCELRFDREDGAA